MTTEPAAPPTCRACGARVQPAVTNASGKPIALETYTEPSGPGRYRVVRAAAGGSPMVVEPVSDHRPVDAFPAHELECPGGRNGLYR